MNPHQDSKRRRIGIFATVALFGLVCGLPLRAQTPNPVPLINQPLVPDATAPGGPQFTLTVNGTGFLSSSTVNWNGSPLVTTFISGSKLTAIVPAADVATAGTASVTVVNAAPGGGASNTAFFTSMAGIGGPAIFSLANSVPTGGGPQAVVTGDFNGDGKLDLAAADCCSGNLYVMLGDGAGHFSLTSFPLVGRWVYSLAAGDFNNDGKLDLAVASFDSGTVSILFGDGTGNFTAGPTINVGTPRSLATGDFNGDGNLDAAVVTADYGTSILLGDGTGNFTLSSTVSTGGWYVVAGDFNNDGKLDLAIAGGYYAVFLLLGDGAGNFTLASSLFANGEAAGIAAGDFNGDGNLDLAVGDYANNAVAVLIGDGTGNFTATEYGAGGGPWGVAAGDFNSDGKLDLAAANVNGGTVAILLEDVPSAGFAPATLSFADQVIGTASKPQSVVMTDTGGANLNITNISASPNFSETNNYSSTLTPGASCTISVTFTPRALGTLAGSIVVADNAFTSPQTIPLTGAGTVVSLSPARLSFGPQTVGTTSAPKAVTLFNRSPRALRVVSIGIGGSDPEDFTQTNNCGTSVAADTSCVINVSFTPYYRGSGTATVEVTDNGGGSPQMVTMKGSGE